MIGCELTFYTRSVRYRDEAEWPGRHTRIKRVKETAINQRLNYRISLEAVNKASAEKCLIEEALNKCTLALSNPGCYMVGEIT